MNHRPDTKLWIAAMHVAQQTPHEPGGIAIAMHHDETSLELDGMIFYAWGKKARNLAETMNVKTARPGYMGAELSLEANEPEGDQPTTQASSTPQNTPSE